MYYFFLYFCNSVYGTNISRSRAVVARRAHNPEVAGSNPVSATKINNVCICAHFFFIYKMGHSFWSYISYLMRKKRSAHSAFVFDFIENVLKNRDTLPIWKEIEKKRRHLLLSNHYIYVTDLGANSNKHGFNSHKKIKSITAHSSKSIHWCRFLARLVRKYQCENIIEFGTAVGISTAYLATANPDKARVFTVEGCSEIAEVAEYVFKDLCIDNIDLVNTDFEYVINNMKEKFNNVDLFFLDGNHTYEATTHYFNVVKEYAKPSSIFIFDDIHWSKDMEKAWEEIWKDEKVTISIDLFQMGVVFFREGIVKQHFIL